MSSPKSPKSPKSAKAKIMGCFDSCVKRNVEPEEQLDQVPHEPIHDQPGPLPLVEVPHSPAKAVLVSPPEETKKGHKRTTSDAHEAVTTPYPVVVPAKPPTPKVSRSESSTSSYQSSISVQTAIEVFPQVRRDSMPRVSREKRSPSVEKAIEKTLPKTFKKETEEPDASQQESKTSNGMADLPEETKSIKTEEVDGAKVSSQATTESHEDNKVKPDEVAKSPKKENEEVKESSQEPKTSRETSQEPKASRESSTEPQDSNKGDESDLPEDVEVLDDVKKLNELIDGSKYDIKHPFFEKISLFYGDITKIQVDAIVNAANAPLSGGGGVDGAIHRAAGYNQLQAECKKHDRPVPTGGAVMTAACKLSTHVKNIIHCVGPVCYGGVTNERRKKLESCYRRAIQLSEENGLRSIAFCCISTGIYGYDNQDAARTVLRFLWKHFNKEENVEKWDRVVLCLFMDIDKKCYKHYIMQLVKDPNYFDDGEEEEDSEDEDEEKDKKKKEKKEDEDENKEKKEHGDENEEKKEDGGEKKEDKTDKKDNKDEKMEEKSDAKEENSTAEKIVAVAETEKSMVEGEAPKKEEAPATASPSR